jgi:hypothetical protein
VLFFIPLFVGYSTLMPGNLLNDETGQGQHAGGLTDGAVA